MRSFCSALSMGSFRHPEMRAKRASKGESRGASAAYLINAPAAPAPSACRQRGLRHHERRDRPPCSTSTVQFWRARSRKRASVNWTEIVHRDDQRRLERCSTSIMPSRSSVIVAVDRRHHDVDAADLVELLLRQRVMQMPEMGDAHIGDLEDEDRIAVALGAAVPVADIGRHVAHAHVLVL